MFEEYFTETNVESQTRTFIHRKTASSGLELLRQFIYDLSKTLSPEFLLGFLISGPCWGAPRGDTAALLSKLLSGVLNMALSWVQDSPIELQNDPRQLRDGPTQPQDEATEFQPGPTQANVALKSWLTESSLQLIEVALIDL